MLTARAVTGPITETDRGIRDDGAALGTAGRGTRVEGGRTLLQPFPRVQLHVTTIQVELNNGRLNKSSSVHVGYSHESR